MGICLQIRLEIVLSQWKGLMKKFIPEKCIQLSKHPNSFLTRWKRKESSGGQAEK